MTKISKTENTIDEDVKQLEPSYGADESVIGSATLENYLAVRQEEKGQDTNTR